MRRQGVAWQLGLDEAMMAALVDEPQVRRGGLLALQNSPVGSMKHPSCLLQSCDTILSEVLLQRIADELAGAG